MDAFVLNNGYSQDGEPVENFEAIFFNQPNDNDDPTSGADRFTCFVPLIEVYQDRPVAGIYTGTLPTMDVCTSYESGIGMFPRNGNNLLDIYPRENRATTVLDSIVVDIRNGRVYDPSEAPRLRVRWDNNGNAARVNFTLPDPIIRDNKLIWINDGSWPNGR